MRIQIRPSGACGLSEGVNCLWPLAYLDYKGEMNAKTGDFFCIHTMLVRNYASIVANKLHAMAIPTSCKVIDCACILYYIVHIVIRSLDQGFRLPTTRDRLWIPRSLQEVTA